jgi:hypothetical protein
MGDRRVKYRVLVGGLEWRKPLGASGVDVWIILKRTLKKWDGEAWIGLVWLRIGAAGRGL